jgi:hypothetical protein
MRRSANATSTARSARPRAQPLRDRRRRSTRSARVRVQDLGKERVHPSLLLDEAHPPPPLRRLIISISCSTTSGTLERLLSLVPIGLPEPRGPPRAEKPLLLSRIHRRFVTGRSPTTIRRTTPRTCLATRQTSASCSPTRPSPWRMTTPAFSGTLIVPPSANGSRRLAGSRRLLTARLSSGSSTRRCALVMVLLRRRGL